jgi:hemolysin activation/secretion protein
MRFRMIRQIVGMAAFAFLASGAAHAMQANVDQTDPSVVREELRNPDRPDRQRDQPVVTARNAAANVAGPSEGVVIGAIRIDGATQFRPSAFAPVISSYLGRPLSGDELRKLATDIANVARNAGFGLATAIIPEQRIVGGVLRIDLEEGRIDAIDAKGGAAKPVRRMLAALVNGKPVRTDALERQILLAGDIAGVSVGKARLERRHGRNVLVVETQRDPVQLRGYIDNWGSSGVGPLRARAVVNLNGVFADNDRLALGALATPANPGEFSLLTLGYRKGIGTRGTEIVFDGYYAHSRPGGALKGLHYSGESIEASIGFEHPIVRSRATSLWLDAGVTTRNVDQSRQGTRIRSDRFSLATAGLYGITDLAGGRIKGRVGIVQGFDVLGATANRDPLASRSDGSAAFSKVEFWSEYDRNLAKRLSVQLTAQAQAASRPLLSSEEIGLGGRYFLRGYDYREFSGDKGVAGSAELRFDLTKLPAPVTAAQVYAYADAGSVGNYRGGAGSGSLASAGGGVRVWLAKKVEADFEVGVPLSRGYAGAKYGPRLSFAVTGRF